MITLSLGLLSPTDSCTPPRSQILALVAPSRDHLRIDGAFTHRIHQRVQPCPISALVPCPGHDARRSNLASAHLLSSVTRGLVHTHLDTYCRWTHTPFDRALVAVPADETKRAPEWLAANSACTVRKWRHPYNEQQAEAPSNHTSGTHGQSTL